MNQQKIPIDELSLLINSYNQIHDLIFTEFGINEVYSKIIPQLEKAVDNALRTFSIDPSEVHELSNGGHNTRESLMIYVRLNNLAGEVKI